MGRRSRKITSNTSNRNANANTNVSQGLVKKRISNLLLGGVKGGKTSSSSQQLPVRLEDPQDHHDHQEQQRQQRRPKLPLSPVLQALRGVGSSRRNVSKGSSSAAGAAAASSAAAAQTKTTKKSSRGTKYNNTPPPVLVITVPDDDDVDDVLKLKDIGNGDKSNNVSMTSTINTSGDDDDDQNHHHHHHDQDVPEWTAVFNDHDGGDEIDDAFDEIDAAAALVNVNHTSTDFPEDEQHCSHDQQQHVQVHFGTSGVIVVQEEAQQDVEEVEIEFYYQNDSEEECEWEADEQPSDCQNEDNVFFALAENNPFLSNKDGSKQPFLPTFVPSSSGVTDFVFGFDNKAVGQTAVAASTGAMAATPSSAASQFSNGFASPLKLAIDDEDEEYGLFDNSDHHLSFLAEATELRMLQQPKLDLDDDKDDDDDDDEEQDHQQLLQDLQREVISGEPVTATSSTSTEDSTSPNQATTDDQGSHVVVRMTSAYESFDVVKVKVENSKTERRQDGEVDEQEQGGEEEDEDEDEKYNLHKVYTSSENLIELEENVPTPVRGSQRKNRTSVLEELGLPPITITTSSSSSSFAAASTTSKLSERTCTTKTDPVDKTSTKSLTLCVDKYGPATFYKILNDLKDNRNIITELHVFRSWHSSNGCKRSTNDIIQLFDVIQSIKFLKVLKISNFSGPEFDGAICDTQLCHPTLSNLQLHIRQGSISKQTLEQLAELPVLDELVMETNESFPFHFALSSKSLTKLTIVANCFDLDNMHLMETINMLRENRVLRSLIIEPPMQLRAFKQLAYFLRSNTTLEELTVSLIPSHLDNDGVSGDDMEAPNHSSLDRFDDETSAAMEVANLLRTNSTLTCLKNKNSAFIKVGQKGASDVLDALVGSNVVVVFTLFDEKEHNGFTKSKNAKLNRNKAVSEISLFKNLFSCSSIGVNVDLPNVEFPKVGLPKVDLQSVDLPKMISNASASASATASNTATVCEEVASESKIVLESVFQDYKDIGNSLRDYKDIGNSLVDDGMKAFTGMSSMVDTMYKQFAF